MPEKTTTHQLQPCLNCGEQLDSAMETGPGQSAPSPGDVSICFYCHHLMVYGEGLKFRAPTDAEIVEMAGDRMIIAAMKALERARKAADKKKPAGRGNHPPAPRKGLKGVLRPS